MISFNFKNAENLIPIDWEKAQKRADAVHAELVKERSSGKIGFWELPDASINSLVSEANKAKKKFDTLIVFGIGGSSVGLRALLRALPKKNGMNVFVVESPEPDPFLDLLKQCDLKKTLFNVISKSGKTTETVALWLVTKALLKKKLGKRWKEHVIFTTDPESGWLREWATEEGLPILSVPPNVGGRFSVLSPVGLFPALCAGLDVKGLLKGASLGRDRALAGGLEENRVYRWAVLQDAATRQGQNISVLFPYSQMLDVFGEWFAQLWAESLGKKGMGQTPMIVMGPMAQHSILQLLQEGPKDKIITFLRVEQFRTKAVVPTVVGEARFLSKKGLAEILNVEQAATASALAEGMRPNITISLPRLSAEVMGELLMISEILIVFLGHWMGINPYDQPGVERSKQITRALLKR